MKTINYSGTSQPSSCSSDAFSSIGTSYAEVPISYTQTSFCGLTPRTVGSCGSSQTACKYDYNHNDALQYIVESKGGTFSRSGWTNKWQIGNNTWKATMSVDSKDNFKSLEVTKIHSVAGVLDSEKGIGDKAVYICG